MAFSLVGDDAIHAIHPSPIPNPYWVAFSTSAAKLIDLPVGANHLPQDSSWLNLLAGNTLSTENHHFQKPIATVYSGHQFGVWAGQLGDGRAILLGEIAGVELQLKGAGKTAYSRMGDGRAVLRSSIREFLCSEAMHHLGIPTSRALSVVGSDLPVRRETMETAAVCARIAPSFIRIGHFEHFASTNNLVRLKELADLLIQDHYQDVSQYKNIYLELFRQICKRNAKLVAQWQAVGFCHGVLNSDNISALGLTIDYGPFGFLDQFQIDHICNHSDQAGRYAYHRQPQIMHWNMACLASAFVPLLALEYSEEEAQNLLSESLSEFPVVFGQTWQACFRKKLGFSTAQDGDIELIERLLQAMHDSRVDFTNFFRGLSSVSTLAAVQDIHLRDSFVDRPAIDQWFTDYIRRLRSESSNDPERKKKMDLVNPKYILRNFLAQRAIEKAQAKDFSEISILLKILENPYAEQTEYEAYAIPPPPDPQSIEVSCSS
jgi:serine/tyrosine/threonine adenylyltransferase